MADILQTLPIRAAADRVFEAIATPAGLDAWWTLRASGVPATGAEYALGFGPGFEWRARVTECSPPLAFELEIVRADADWTGTRVGFRLQERAATTWVQFAHVGWPGANEHFRVSTHCWALYLRLLRRHLENGERVPYERRLDA